MLDCCGYPDTPLKEPYKDLILYNVADSNSTNSILNMINNI